MSAEPIAVLRTLAGTPIPLTEVRLAGTVEGCLFEFTVEQHYRNVETQAIEAVYTFPLPLQAVLLSLELTIGERTLQGVVQRKRAASEAYEQAIGEGHSAMLLEKARDGLYTVSLGNLLAGETAVIRYRYAQLLSFEQGRVRLMIPTAVVPRYGNPNRAVGAHQVPGSDLAAHYPCRLHLTVRGDLARAAIRSPTHDLTSREEGSVRVLESRTGFALDRDLVVLIEGVASPLQSLVDRDGDGYVALASFTAPPVAASGTPARAIKMVVDCSGSMAGDSIDQARAALAGTLSALGETDLVSLTRFGSQWEHATEGLAALNATARARLEAVVRQTDATLGGTEMLPALEAVLAIPVPRGMAADVLLITDGDIWELDALLEKLASAQHRLFVIAVGSSPAEELARKVASLTRGACEFVTPGEDMRGAVARLLARMGAPVLTVASVQWPAEPAWSMGEGSVVFPGDTGHVFAGFASAPAGPVTVTVAGDAEPLKLHCTLVKATNEVSELARLAAAYRLPMLDREQAATLAEHHQLVSDYTSCVVVLAREAGAATDDLPALRQVPQMLVAGWGGAGRVASTVVWGKHAPRDAALPRPPSRVVDAPPMSAGFDVEFCAMSLAPAADEREIIPSLVPTGDQRFLSRIADLCNRKEPLPTTLADLIDLGLSEAILEPLRRLIGKGFAEADVVAAWLAEFANGPAGRALSARLKQRLDRAAVRPLRDTVRQALLAGPEAIEAPVGDASRSDLRVADVIRNWARGVRVEGKAGKRLLQPSLAPALRAHGYTADEEDVAQLLRPGMPVWRSKDDGVVEVTQARRRIDIVVYRGSELVALIETESDLDDLRVTGVSRRSGHYDVFSIARSATDKHFDSYKSLERMAAAAFYAHIAQTGAAYPLAQDGVARLESIASDSPNQHNPSSIELYLVVGRCRSQDPGILQARMQSLGAQLIAIDGR